LPSPFAFINLVLPTNICSITIDHDVSFELSAVPVKVELFQLHTGFVIRELIGEAGRPYQNVSFLKKRPHGAKRGAKN
jgi:hypothetical protein